MTFLELTDFDAHIRSADLDKILASDFTILDDVELFAIDRIKAEIEGRFDTTAIFAATGTSRSSLIINFTVRIVIYEIYSRINPRNIPDLVQFRYDDTLDVLKRINNEELNPSGLPILKDTEGNDKEFMVLKSRPKKAYDY